MSAHTRVEPRRSLRQLLTIVVAVAVAAACAPFLYVGFGQARDHGFHQTARDEATATDLALLPACPRSSADYASRMNRRGFSVKRVTAPKTYGSPEIVDALLLHFQAGSQATTRNLSNPDEVRANVLKRMYTPDKPNSLRACPYWLEAARIRAFEDLRRGGGVTGLEGFGDVVATCDDEDSLQIYPEADLFERHLPWKPCTAATCLSRTRPACQKFIDSDGASPLPVFRYNTFDKERHTVDVAGTLFGTPGLRVVENPDDACLFVFDGREKGSNMMKQWVEETDFTFERLEHWNLVDGVPGRNHVLWHPSCVVHCDYDATRYGHGPLGEAVVVSPVHLHSMFRPGFDISLSPHFRLMIQTLYEAKQPRAHDGPQVKLFFRGSAKGHTKWDMDRMIASAFSHAPRKGIIIQSKVRRQPRPTGISACDVHTTEPEYNASYVEMMSSTSFAFTPGGGGAYSYRLGEALGAGAIPVVTEDLVLPFHSIAWYPAEELWKSCAVFVSPEEVYGLGFVIDAVLAEGAEKFEQRRESCQKLWDDLFFDSQYYEDGNDFEAAYFRGATRTVVKELSYRLLN